MAQQSDPAGVDASGGVLAELEAKLRAPDSILEPGVLDLLKEYLRAGGKPQAAIEDLSENYAGYPQMCDVMCQWLEIADVRIGTSSSKPGSAGGAVPSAVALSSTSMGSAAAGDGQVPDEFTLLQDLAKERFDATRFLGVFRKGHPDWLNELISDRRGRQLIYELSSAHKNSLLLNYAIQRILKQGHEDEVSMVGGSLASYFEVYHRLLATRLAAATRATTPQQLSQLAAEIAESCISSQHTYVHAQQLLTAAASWPGGGVFRRLSQEVEAAAVAKQGGAKVYQLQPLLAPLTASPAEREAIELVSEVLIRSAPTLPGVPSSAAAAAAGAERAAAQLVAVAQPLGQLQVLYQQQQQQQGKQQDGCNGLSIAPLQHPQLMQLLLSGMFAADSIKQTAAAGPNEPSKTELRDMCIQLLALAVSGRSEQGHQAAAAAAAATSGAAGDPRQQTHEAGDDNAPADQQQQQQRQEEELLRGASPPVNQQQQQEQHSPEEVAALLQKALLLAHKVSHVRKLGPAELDMAAEVCKQPLAALGLLQHSQQLLGNPDAYGEEKMTLFLPNHLSLLHRVACEQPSLIAQVLAVLRTVLTALGSNKQELSKSVLHFLVSLMVSGAADMAVDMAKSWSSTADPSLVRHFILLVLESVEPPYSASFARSMLHLMHTGLIMRMKASHTKILHDFATACRESSSSWLPALSFKDDQLVEQLLKP